MALRVRQITDENEWLKKWRMANVNASEAGALFGIDKHRSPLQLYYEKRGEVTVDDTNALRRGRWLEPAVIKATKEKRPDLEINPCGLYFDDPALRVGCTPDAFALELATGRKGVVQAKTVGENVFKEWMDEDETVNTPLSYQLQTMIESVQTTRADFGLLSILIVGYRVDLFGPVLVTPEEKAWEAFLYKVKEFWTNFEKGVAPPVSPSLDGDLMKKIYPGVPGSIIDLSMNNRLPALVEEHEAQAAALSTIRATMKPINERYQELRTELKSMIGDHETAILPGGYQATYKLVERRASASRVLRVSEVRRNKRS